jgi:uncharacterized protein YaaN involved in tellurite resistance
MSDSLNIDQVAAPSPSTVSDEATAAASAAQTGTLTLTPPAPVAAVPANAAENAVKLDPDTVKKLDGMVGSYMDAVTKLDVHDPAFEARVADIRKLGEDDIKASSRVSSKLLDRPVSSMQHGGLSATSQVSNSLLQLRHTVDDLDPARQGDLFHPRKLLGVIPFGDKLRDYFDKYRSSQSHINAIITAMYHGQDTLRADNADIEQEKVKLWATMERLRQYIYLAQKLDTALSARIAEIEASDPDRARVLKEDMLFYVRQKVQDLLTQLAVSVQGYLALDVIKRNNLELIKGVERATTTTISALRTAVVVAQALADQKLVLDQITALNSTTSHLIESTSALLRQQSGQINEQAAASTIDIKALQAAFDNIYATMDEIDTFKVKALDNMSQTIDTLSTQVTKAQAYLDRVKPAEGGDEASALSLK